MQGAFTRAGARVLQAYQGDVWLGASEPIDVLAGEAQGLRLVPLLPWAWVDEPAD